MRTGIFKPTNDKGYGKERKPSARSPLSEATPLAPPSVREAHDKAAQGYRLWAEFRLFGLLSLDDSTVLPASKGGKTACPQGKADGQSHTDGQHFARAIRQLLPTTSSKNQQQWIINRKNN